MSEIKLLPCPFCSGRPEVIEVTEDDGFENRGGSAIECQVCHASSHVEFGRKENLISSWNRRAALASAAVAEREPVALTPTALADAFDAMWNAVLGVSNERQEGMAVASMLAEGFSAMGRVLRDNVPTPPTSELEAENARLQRERDDFKDEWQAELEKRMEVQARLRAAETRLAEAMKSEDKAYRCADYAAAIRAALQEGKE